jgi:DNA (cytosine-5)-methyltransferase 1
MSQPELQIDGFAGGGGASSAVEAATGRSPDVAINHDEEALAVHALNHPNTEHLDGDIWDFRIGDYCRGRPVGLIWLSPSCTDFSHCRGNLPMDAQKRALPFVAVRWLRETRARLCIVENVPAMERMGRLDSNGRPDPRFIGHTYATWLGKIRALGYQVEARTLVASDYGAGTSRERLFIVARNDGQPICWPRSGGLGRRLHGLVDASTFGLRC